MSEDWAAIAAEVAEALGDFEPVTIHHPGVGGTFNPATDTTTGGSAPTTEDGFGVEDKFDAYTVSTSAGSILATDVKLLLSPLKADGQVIAPPVQDVTRITLSGGRSFLVKRSDATRPAGTTVLYEVQLRA